MKPANSNLACSCVARPIIKSHPEKLPKMLGFSFNISAMAEASDLKIGQKLGFHRAHQKKSTQKKSGLGRGPRLWRFLFNIFATAESSDFKFGMQLAFSKAHRKVTPARKSRHGRLLG